MKEQKHIIWSSYDLDPKDWVDGYKEYCEINDLEYDENDYDALLDYMYDTNREYLYDERANLDMTLPCPILVIADLGLWNGRRTGYKITGKNLNDIFDVGDVDDAEFWCDRYNVRGKGSHHDGTNYYTMRMLKEGSNYQNLLDAIYLGKPISSKMLSKYTTSLRPYVAKVYGW